VLRIQLQILTAFFRIELKGRLVEQEIKVIIGFGRRLFGYYAKIYKRILKGLDTINGY